MCTSSLGSTDVKHQDFHRRTRTCKPTEAKRTPGFNTRKSIHGIYERDEDMDKAHYSHTCTYPTGITFQAKTRMRHTQPTELSTHGLYTRCSHTAPTHGQPNTDPRTHHRHALVYTPYWVHHNVVPSDRNEWSFSQKGVPFLH